jgi:zinc protease
MKLIPSKNILPELFLSKTALPKVFLTVAFFAAAGCATQEVRVGAASAGDAAAKSGAKFGVQEFRLDNGLKLLVVEDGRSPTFAYQTWFRVGSRDELPGKTGLAHLFEHMMFKETKNLKDGEFDRLLEQAGAEGENASTSRDYTDYVQELPKDKLGLITKLEADRMVNLVVDEKNFKTEIEVVQNERRFRNENSPDGIMYQEIFEIAFTKQPYHWPVIGYQKDLQSMSAADALEFYKKHYAPNNATVVVVGDVDADDVHSLVKRHYGDLKPSELKPTDIVLDPPQTAPKRKTLKLNIQVEKLMVGYRVPGIDSSDIPALGMLVTVLSGGKSSRLHQALVESGIASEVEAYDLDDKDPSLFLIAANMQKGRKAAQAESIILKELARLVKEPIGAQELERARNQTSFGFFEGLSSDMAKARFLGTYEVIAGDYRVGFKHFDQAMFVTPEEIQAVAAKYFQPSNRTVITGVKK